MLCYIDFVMSLCPLFFFSFFFFFFATAQVKVFAAAVDATPKTQPFCVKTKLSVPMLLSASILLHLVKEKILHFENLFDPPPPPPQSQLFSLEQSWGFYAEIWTRTRSKLHAQENARATLHQNKEFFKLKNPSFEPELNVSTS